MSSLGHFKVVDVHLAETQLRPSANDAILWLLLAGSTSSIFVRCMACNRKTMMLVNDRVHIAVNPAEANRIGPLESTAETDVRAANRLMARFP